MESKDGASFKIGDTYTIAYNEDMMEERKRFTICHEIGHIALGHFSMIKAVMFSRNSRRSREERVFENEADLFARNMLAPAAVYDAMQFQGVNETKAFFGISKACARMRCENAQNDLSQVCGALNGVQLARFKPFLQATTKEKKGLNRSPIIVALDNGVPYDCEGAFDGGYLFRC